MITFKDFTKIEIKIGKVVHAERVPNTDKLIVAQVDVGEERLRQIVSGIAEKYSPEDLIGKSFPYATNLEPRTFKGVESNGMLLAAKDGDGHPVLLNPSEDVQPGASVV